MPENPGLPIDTAPLPEWAKAYLSPAQLDLDRGLLWCLLVYESRTLTDSATSVAQRLFVHAIGKDVKRMWPTQKRIAHNVKLSENTVIAALDLLVEQGWILREPKRGDRRRWIYTLAWPTADRVVAAPKTAACGSPTGKGKTCTRPAGWGTSHKGLGRCKLHDPEPPQPLRSSVSESPQVVEPTTSMVEGEPPQPLEQKTSMVEDKYVRECVTESVSGSGPGSLSPVAEVEVPSPPSATADGPKSTRLPDRIGPALPRPGDAARVADDARGRRWLVEAFLLSEGQADEAITIVRGIDPTIRNLTRYLQAMHRDEHGQTKPDLLDIVEAVQTTARQPADPEDAEPLFAPPPQIFSSPSGCSHDSPNADRSGCNICHAATPTRPPQEPAPAPATPDHPLTAALDPCNHGVPGGYLPAAETDSTAEADPDPGEEVRPSCIRCRSHVIAAQCRKKNDPCPHCAAMREAAGLPPLAPNLAHGSGPSSQESRSDAPARSRRAAESGSRPGAGS